jgi:hypothetical protein
MHCLSVFPFFLKYLTGPCNYASLYICVSLGRFEASDSGVAEDSRFLGFGKVPLGE